MKKLLFILPRQGLLLLALVLFLPVVTIYLSWLEPQTDAWQHLADTVLSDYVINTLILAFGVGGLSLLIGTSCAWLIVFYRFPGHGYLQWLLLLPLAMPAYIIAYTYTGMLDFAGPVQSQLREWFDWRYGDYWFPEVRSLPGAIVMMALVLYPYVYLMARTAFASQSQSLHDVCRTLGLSRIQGMLSVSLPMARPAIFAGTALAMMEAFADYGTVQYFGVATFTTGIFRTWFGMGNALAAAQLSAALCSLVLVLLLFEQWSRRKQRYYQSGDVTGANSPIVLKPWLQWGVTLCVSLPFVLGFALPAGQLLVWAWDNLEQGMDPQFMTLLWNSFYLAFLAALIIVAVALLLAYGKRLWPSPALKGMVRGASLGYALPGTVIAIGVMLPLGWLDRSINDLSESWFGSGPGLLFSGTLVALIFAYTVRFMTVALNGIDNGLQQIKPHMDDAAATLGAGKWRLLFGVHLPILRSSVLMALLLVFVDVLKELPATLILRPFNFNTLAVRAYELAADERLTDAALPALSIVLTGLIPVILLSRMINQPRKSHA